MPHPSGYFQFQKRCTIDRGAPELVTEWLEHNGGAENVLEELMRIVPALRVTALWNDAPERFTSPRVRETWVGRTPIRHSKPLAVLASLLAMRSLGRSEASWVLSSSHLFAHHARFSGAARNARRYSYVHTPARYIWRPDLDARGAASQAVLLAPLLRAIDRRAARQLHSIAVNSNAVAERVKSAWGMESRVIHPPVDVTGLRSLAHEPAPGGAEATILDRLPQEFLLGASRFVPYKKLDEVIRFAEASGLPAVIAGDGPMKARLMEQAASATVNVTVVVGPSRRMLAELYSRSLAYVFPAEEDFGIMPVEAMALGTPVIGLSRGGTSESVIHLKTGFLMDDFDQVDASNVIAQVRRLEARDCTVRADAFATDVFRASILDWLRDEISPEEPSAQ